MGSNSRDGRSCSSSYTVGGWGDRAQRIFRPRIQAKRMKIKYFEDTDTLHIVFRQQAPVETRDLDEDILIDLDADGQVCSMTLEHAKERVGDPEVQFERVTAEQGAPHEPPPAAAVRSLARIVKTDLQSGAAADSGGR